MQANFGRSSSAHDIALTHAFENNIDILLIQEPWIFSDLSKRRSKSHNAYEAFCPLSEWTTRPRVFTYVRNSAKLKAFQSVADLSRDLLQITISPWGTRRIGIWNIYNAPAGSDDAGGGLKMLLNCYDTPHFIGGDFNLRHPLWDLTAINASSSCQDFIDWIDSRGLRLLNPIETPTHNRGGTIDLALCIDEKVDCQIRPDLHTTSDHETLVSTLYKESETPDTGKLRYNTLDNDLFIKLLNNQN